MIDEVINFIDNNVEPEEGTTHADVIMGRCPKTEIIKVLEQIRVANSTLREWGNDHHRNAYDFENERDDFERKCEDMQREIDDLKSENSRLENENIDLSEELSSIETEKNSLHHPAGL